MSGERLQDHWASGFLLRADRMCEISYKLGRGVTSYSEISYVQKKELGCTLGKHMEISFLFRIQLNICKIFIKLAQLVRGIIKNYVDFSDIFLFEHPNAFKV